MKRLLLLLFALSAIAPAAHANNIVDHVYAGVNGAWLNGPGSAWPADVELGGWASTAPQPHWSLVGGAFYGFSHSYVRWEGGPQFTVTDANDPNISVGLGLRYRGGSIPAVGPNEWAAGTSAGWRPLPQDAKWSALLIGGSAFYGLDSNRLMLTLGARYTLPIKF